MFSSVQLAAAKRELLDSKALLHHTGTNDKCCENNQTH